MIHPKTWNMGKETPGQSGLVVCQGGRGGSGEDDLIRQEGVRYTLQACQLQRVPLPATSGSL